MAIQYKLRDVGQGECIAPGNAFEGNQLDEIAKKAIDRGRIREARNRGEELSGSGFGGMATPQEALGVMGAKFDCRRLKGVRMIARRNLLGRCDEHAAAAAQGVDMSAAQRLLVIIDLGERPRSRIWHGNCARHPLPLVFAQEFDSMGVTFIVRTRV